MSVCLQKMVLKRVIFGTYDDGYRRDTKIYRGLKAASEDTGFEIDRILDCCMEKIDKIEDVDFYFSEFVNAYFAEKAVKRYKIDDWIAEKLDRRWIRGGNDVYVIDPNSSKFMIFDDLFACAKCCMMTLHELKRALDVDGNGKKATNYAGEYVVLREKNVDKAKLKGLLDVEFL